VLDGNYSFINELFSLGFKRVQINATKANNVIIDMQNIPTIIANIRKSISNLPGIEWILQYNEETRCICDDLLFSPLSNMSVLYDSSCGLGIEMTDFPTPKNKVNDIYIYLYVYMYTYIYVYIYIYIHPKTRSMI
jgi:hypothetical protein